MMLKVGGGQKIIFTKHSLFFLQQIQAAGENYVGSISKVYVCVFGGGG